MIILYGTHRTGLKKIGARKDFCNACERECVGEQWRSFDLGHVFFIPILPLGTRERWRCSLCGKDPRARYTTSKPLRIIGLFVLPVFILPVFLVHDDTPPTNPGEAYGPYVIAAGVAAVWVYLLYSTFFRRDSGPPEDQRRAAVVPLSTDSCPYCHGPLTGAPDYRCPSCDIRIDGESSQPLRPPPLPAAQATKPSLTSATTESGRCPLCGMLRAHAGGCPNAR